MKLGNNLPYHYYGIRMIQKLQHTLEVGNLSYLKIKTFSIAVYHNFRNSIMAHETRGFILLYFSHRFLHRATFGIISVMGSGDCRGNKHGIEDV